MLGGGSTTQIISKIHVTRQANPTTAVHSAAELRNEGQRRCTRTESSNSTRTVLANGGPTRIVHHSEPTHTITNITQEENDKITQKHTCGRIESHYNRDSMQHIQSRSINTIERESSKEQTWKAGTSQNKTRK